MGYRRTAVGVQQERAGLDRCPGWASSGARLIVEVEVARRLLLEPEPVVLRRLLEEVGRLLEHVLLARLGIRWLGLDRLGGCGPGRCRRLVGARVVVDRWGRRRVERVVQDGGAGAIRV